MSLVTSPTRVILYNNARVLDALGNYPKVFWEHVINKELLSDENWWALSWGSISSHPDHTMRRVDFHYGSDDLPRLRIFYITETQEGISRYTAESQIQESCEDCIIETTTVWVMVVIGTTAKMFRHTEDEFIALTADYIDANEPRAQEIRDVFAEIRANVLAEKPSA